MVIKPFDSAQQHQIFNAALAAIRARDERGGGAYTEAERAAIDTAIADSEQRAAELTADNARSREDNTNPYARLDPNVLTGLSVHYSEQIAACEAAGESAIARALERERGLIEDARYWLSTAPAADMAEKVL